MSTDCLYWSNRLIAALADAHYYETSNMVEGFAEAARAFGHRLVERTDAKLAALEAESADGFQNIAQMEESNDEMAEYLRKHVTKLLNDVLYTSSNLMRNSFAMSDRWN